MLEELRRSGEYRIARAASERKATGENGGALFSSAVRSPYNNVQWNWECGAFGHLTQMENEQVTCYPRVMNWFKSLFPHHCIHSEQV